jgi:5-methylcytosine-specific restriction enzyme subunit McrC
LDVLARVSANPHLAALARSHWMSFLDVDDITVNERTFILLPHTRNTERYRRALRLGRLIILNYSPDVQSGREDVLAILFDMNCLFERFVYAQLRQAEARQPSHSITFKAEVSRPFWMADRMRKSVKTSLLRQALAPSVSGLSWTRNGRFRAMADQATPICTRCTRTTAFGVAAGWQ